MRILLNGKPLSQRSAIMQYIGEPMYRWCEKLPQLMYSEIDDMFSVEYCGNIMESVVLDKIFGDYQHCVGFSYIEPVLNMSIQERMIEINNLVISKISQEFAPEAFKANFDGSKNILEKWRDYISEIDIRNRICRIDIDISSSYPPKGTKFIIAEDYDEAQKISLDTTVNEYAFILFENSLSGFCFCRNGYYGFGFNSESFFDMVFECLQLYPLSDIIYLCAKRVQKHLNDEKSFEDLQKIISTESIVKVNIPERIECSTGAPIEIKVFPSEAPFPVLDFKYQFENIISCTQQRIFGISPGKVKVEVYIKGEYTPLTSQTVTVYSRNRISSITLSDQNLTMGINSLYELSYEFVPRDADNTSSIKWYSSDRKIADVNEKGFVKALSLGKCTIYCSAGKVFAQCSVTVLPYAEEIVFNGDSSITELVVPLHGSVSFYIKVCPENAIDRNVIASSSNLMTANIVGDSIVGLAVGEAVITAENSSKSLRRSLKVRVLDEKGMKKEQKQNIKTKKRFFNIFKGE